MNHHTSIISDHYGLAGLAGLADMPPCNFDDPAFAASLEPVFDKPAVRTSAFHDLPLDHAVEKPATRMSVKIARSRMGTDEIRLVVEKREGAKDVYILETTQLQPYAPVAQRLMKDDKPLSQAQAIKQYNKAVAEKYPVEVLRSGAVSARHHDIL